MLHAYDVLKLDIFPVDRFTQSSKDWYSYTSKRYIAMGKLV